MKKKQAASGKSNAWESADFQYASLQASQMMPMFGQPLSPDETDARLIEIVESCSDYYPAVVELGLRRVARGAGKSEERRIHKGLRLMLKLGDPEDLDDHVELIIENLENSCRFDVARTCLELLTKKRPDNALFHDYLAYAASKLGDLETAFRESALAVAIEPSNSFFLSNVGLFHLMAGNAAEAKQWLTESLNIDPDNETTRGNLKIADYLTEHGGSLTDYLLRPLDLAEIERLEDEEDDEELDRLAAGMNSDRLVAFSQSIAQNIEKRPRCETMPATLNSFFDFVDRIANMVGLLYERLPFVQQHFDAIMNKFIYKFGDVDRQMINDICDSLLEFYGFLERSKLVPTNELKAFEKLIKSRREGLLKKMERYNAIRHDDDVDDDEKEEIRCQLFGDDHLWPHL